jgi:hypothetical protein
MSSSNKALSAREELYAVARARGLSGTASAIAAGYSSNKGTASVTSARINAREHVKARIAALMASDTLDDDRARHIAKLEELRDKAVLKGQVAASIRAQELIGKARGVSGDDTASITISTPLEDANSSDLRSALQSAIDRFGITAFKQPAADDDEPQPAAGEAVH